MKPEYLFHYTSIETLAMILSTKKIKFSALSQVDDIDEGKSQDFSRIGEYFFVSCWTDLEEESLPFWNMYTPDMRGVRIKMPSDLFINNIIINDDNLGLQPGYNNSIVPQNETFQKDYWITPTHNEFLKKIEYTSCSEKLFPKIETIIGDRFTIKLNKIGTCKAEHWKFQSEWRYILKIMPHPIRSSDFYLKSNSDIISDSINSMRNGDKLPFTNYFVEIGETQFEQMEIVLGPKYSTSDKIILESLIKTYNPKARITISSLHKRVR